MFRLDKNTLCGQEYFFPKEELAVNERQRKWVKSVNARSRHSRQSSAASNPGSDTEISQQTSSGPAPPSSVFAAAALLASTQQRPSLLLEERSPSQTSPDGKPTRYIS